MADMAARVAGRSFGSVLKGGEMKNLTMPLILGLVLISGFAVLPQRATAKAETCDIDRITGSNYDMECPADYNESAMESEANEWCNLEEGWAHFSEGPHPIPFPLLPGQDPDAWHGVFECW
jgi:hypothetical protein